MLKEKRTTQRQSSRRTRTYTSTIYVYECDECHQTFERKRPERRLMQYCTRECYQNSARHGVAHVYTLSVMTPEVLERKKQTMIERYGIASFMSLPEVRANARQTCIERYGSPSSMGDSKVRAKKEATFIERYGTTVPIAYNVDVIMKSCKAMSNVQTLHHWKTNARLCCRGSYEIAFINWCNTNCIDFDWQIPFEMPDGHTYIIDAFIKDGDHANTWVEIKGYMRPKGRQKWEWFCTGHTNAELWDMVRLQEVGVLI